MLSCCLMMYNLYSSQRPRTWKFAFMTDNCSNETFTRAEYFMSYKSFAFSRQNEQGTASVHYVSVYPDKRA